MKFSAIITAGGSSIRFGKDKLLEKISSKEVIKYSVEAFLSVKKIDTIIISANKSIIPNLQEFFKQEPRIKIIEGGKTRQQSVFNGLLALQNQLTPNDFVLIHDGARPMINSDLIERILNKVQEVKALTVATKTIDTIKKVDAGLKVIETIDRSCLYNTQTPQAFEYGLIQNAHEKLAGMDFTDDAGMLESLAHDVYILEGNYKNIKITNPCDIEVARIYLQCE